MNSKPLSSQYLKNLKMVDILMITRLNNESEAYYNVQILSILQLQHIQYPFHVEDDSDIGFTRIDGPPIMPEDPYAYIMAAYEVPPSPDYIPGPEVPPSPDYIPGPEVPPSPDYIPGPKEPQSPPPLDFVPELIYP
ncbi:hypothetical protein Tco_1319761 [Tanacetum coccineum]